MSKYRVHNTTEDALALRWDIVEIFPSIGPLFVFVSVQGVEDLELSRFGGQVAAR